MSMWLPPGFRFNPTDEELVFYYLRNRAASDSEECPVPVVIADVDVYKFDPWNLPSQAVHGDKEWYFFTPRDRKYPNGIRPNRTAGSGYWRCTGIDKPIHDRRCVVGGVKKALAFYEGRTPIGTKTGWVMHEYRLATTHPVDQNPIKLRHVSTRLDDWVLCRIYKKKNRGQASPMAVPPLTLADYDYAVGHDDLSGGSGFNDAPGFFAPSSSTMIAQNHHHHQQQLTGCADPTRELFDMYAVAQIFDTPQPEHLPIHPSLNQLLFGGDNAQVEPLPSPATSGRTASPKECGGDGGSMVVGRPPVVVQDAQQAVPGRGAAAVVTAVVAERLTSRGCGAAACAQP